MDLVKILSEQYMKPELPEMNVGDTVRVLVRVKEGNRERTQAFEGTIIAKKHGGINETITVRRISYGVGCKGQRAHLTKQYAKSIFRSEGAFCIMREKSKDFTYRRRCDKIINKYDFF